MSRVATAAVLPLVVAVAVTSWFVTASEDRLPERLATHWDGSGSPDGFSSLGSFLVTTVSVGAMSWVLATILSLTLAPHLRSFTIFVAWLPGAAAGFTAALIGATVLANRDHLGAEAELGALAANGPVLGLLAGGLLGAVTVGRAPDPAPPDGNHDEVILHETTLVWRGAFWLAAGFAVAGIALVALTKVVVLLLLAPLLLAFSQYHLRITDTRLTVRGGLFGWPSAHYRLEEIRAVEVTEVHAFREWGGWGLRLRLDGSHGLINRSGPAVELTLDDGKRFVMTPDDPGPVVDALRAMAGDRR